MLCLTRRVDQVIRIGDHIKVKVLELSPSYVRLGIQAPYATHIIREELLYAPGHPMAGPAGDAADGALCARN